MLLTGFSKLKAVRGRWRKAEVEAESVVEVVVVVVQVQAIFSCAGGREAGYGGVKGRADEQAAADEGRRAREEEEESGEREKKRDAASEIVWEMGRRGRWRDGEMERGGGAGALELAGECHGSGLWLVAAKGCTCQWERQVRYLLSFDGEVSGSW
ncbi:hypothetical protein G7046_g311 [Stylonectria norvegica]|nr:hypothetical protein G7046_g311 [Stylonectria norvegica]